MPHCDKAHADIAERSDGAGKDANGGAHWFPSARYPSSLLTTAARTPQSKKAQSRGVENRSTFILFNDAGHPAAGV
jgi:hypothetical protein